MPSTRVVEETTEPMQAFDQQLPTFDALELVDMQDLTGEAEEEKASLIARRRKKVNPPTTNEPEPPSVEEASPSVVVREVLADLAPLEEVVESHSGAEGEAVDTQSFAFDARREEEPPVKQLDEVTHADVKLVGEASTEVREEDVLQLSSLSRNK